MVPQLADLRPHLLEAPIGKAFLGINARDAIALLGRKEGATHAMRRCAAGCSIGHIPGTAEGVCDDSLRQSNESGNTEAPAGWGDGREDEQSGQDS